MSAPAALLATFVGLRTLSDGQVRITLDAQCTLSEISALGLMPGVAFGIARIKGEATIPKVEEDKPKGGPLAKLAGQLCRDPLFIEWLDRINPSMAPFDDRGAAMVIRMDCGIGSRSELDHNSTAAEQFHSFVRKPFMAWKEANNK